MKTRILVIDDDHLVADTLCMVYRANGYESEARYSTADGMEHAKSYEPAVVLCGVTLPHRTNGEDLPGHPKLSSLGSRMLLLTPHAASLRNTTRNLAQDDDPSNRPLCLLKKPCSPDDLLRETRALLSAI